MVQELPDRYAPLRDALDKALDKVVQSNQLLGVSFAVADRRGHVLYADARGFRDFEKRELMTVDTAGFLASMTKVMASVAAMQVVDKGLIGLDDDVGQIVPELGDRKIITAFDAESMHATFQDPAGKITLRQLLSHTSGFAYDATNEIQGKWSAAHGKDQEAFTGQWKAWTRPLVFEPGTSWVYSTGIDWAGKVVETLTSQTLEEYMLENIWQPIGMKNTTFHPENRKSFPILELGFRANGEDEPLTATKSRYPMPAPHDMGGCGLYSTAEDYIKLLSALISDECLLLSKKSFQEFIKPQLSDSSFKALKSARDRGLVQPDIPQNISVDHALGGLITIEDVPGRRKKGSMCWDGMTNPNWMLDYDTGICCAMLVQVLPCPDPCAKRLWTELEEIVYLHSRSC